MTPFLIRQFTSGLAAILILTTLAISQSKAKKAELVLTKCWSYSLGDRMGERIASDGNKVFIGLEGGHVEGLSVDGKKLWSTDLGGEITSEMVIKDTSVYLTSTAVKGDGAVVGDSVLYSLSAETGVTNWTVKVPRANIYFLRIVPQGLIAFGASGGLQLIDPRSGSTLWRQSVDAGIEVGPWPFSNEIIVGSSATHLSFISLAKGERQDRSDFPADITALARGEDGSFFVGDKRGVITSFAPGTKAVRWKFKSGGAIAAITLTEGKLVVASHDNFLYMISTRDGHVRWRRRLSGRVLGLTHLPNQWLVVEGAEEHSPLVIIDLEKGGIAGQMPVGASESITGRANVADGRIAFLTNEAAYSYSSGVCNQNEGGTIQRSAPPSIKK